MLVRMAAKTVVVHSPNASAAFLTLCSASLPRPCPYAAAVAWAGEPVGLSSARSPPRQVWQSSSLLGQ